MAVPEQIHKLIDRFDDNLDAYRSGQYKETQLRREFIDPFFKALGWDVDNVQGYAEAYKDVFYEDAVNSTSRRYPTSGRVSRREDDSHVLPAIG